jgi:hypothetical protein
MAKKAKATDDVKPPKDEEVKKQIGQMYARFRKAEGAVSPKLHPMWKMLDTFDRGDQWKDAAVPPWVPKPVTNFIRYIRTLKRANLASAIPKAKFSPVYPQDVDIVGRLQKAYDHVWETEEVARKVRRAIDRAVLQGTAIIYVYNDDDYVGGRYYSEGNPANQLYKGKICTKRFPNANFFPDPDAYCIEECKWIETTELLPFEQIRENMAFRNYCEKNGTLDKLDALNADLLERSDSSAGTIYGRDNKPTDGFSAVSGDEMALLHTHWERNFKRGKWHLTCTYYIPNLDFYLLRLEDIQPNEYPFAILYDEEEENSFWGSSTCMDVLENQKIINKLQQTAAIIGVLHQNPQKIVGRESGINAQELARTGTLPGKVWTANGDPSKAIHVLEPMDIPKGLFELDDRTQNNIRQIVGVNEAYTGQSVGSLTTSTGVQDLIERATIRDKDKMVQIDAFVERLSHLIVLMILHKWEDERPITTVAPNGTPQFEMYSPVSKIDRENLEWRVKSNVYAKAPMTQAAKRQQADKLLQTQGQFQFNPPVITPEEWVKMQEFDETPDILKRMEADRQQIEQDKANNLADQMAQLSQQALQLAQKGTSVDQIAQFLQQAAQEMLAKQEAQDLKNGISSQKPPMASPVQGPKGVTGEVQMANMARG